LRPCDENLATQIEEGYIKLKPFRAPVPTPKSPTTPTPEDPKDKSLKPPLQASPQIKPKDTVPEAEVKSPVPRSASPFRFPRSSTPSSQPETVKKEMIWKLLGDQHMGKYVVYTNATTAWLLSDDLYGKLTSSVYSTITAGIHMGGSKLVRGYIEGSKQKTTDKEVSELKAATLGAKMAGGDEAIVEAVADQAEEKEMEQDYDTTEKEDPTRCPLPTQLSLS
jgi:hypothetical protein